MRLPNAGLELAQKLKSELETSSDAAPAGVTAELLVEPLESPGGQDQSTEAVKSAAFGKQLLNRARRLDPHNPEWAHQDAPRAIPAGRNALVAA